MSSVNENKLTLEDVIRRTPGVTNLYDMFGPELMYNLRQSNRTFKNLIENELRDKFVKKEETESVYLVVTQAWNIFEKKIETRKEYFSPNNIHHYIWSWPWFYVKPNIETQRDMRQKMIEGKCFINYKIPVQEHIHYNRYLNNSNKYIYIFAFKLHGCDEL